MEKVWSDDGNPHEKFLRTLLNNRVTEMVTNTRKFAGGRSGLVTFSRSAALTCTS